MCNMICLIVFLTVEFPTSIPAVNAKRLKNSWIYMYICKLESSYHVDILLTTDVS
jgi:uncharacterized protein YlaI